MRPGPRLISDVDPDYKPTPEQPLVYHLFGRLDVEDSLVITEDHYFDYLIGAARNSDSIPAVVRERLAETRPCCSSASRWTAGIFGCSFGVS